MNAKVGMVGVGIMGSRMCANLVKAGFDVHAFDLMFKDLRLFVETATQLQSPALVGATALQIYNAACAAGHGERDPRGDGQVLIDAYRGSSLS